MAIISPRSPHCGRILSPREALNYPPTPVSSSFTLRDDWGTLAKEGLEVRRRLGQGNFSTIHLAWKASEESYRCVKRFKACTSGSDTFPGPMSPLEEYQLMKAVESHPRIAKAFAFFQDADFSYIEMEFHEGGDFTTIRHRAIQHGVNLTEDWWGQLMKQCLEGLEHIHDYGIIHCDIKEQNLMLKTPNFHNPSVVLIDFGLAQRQGLFEGSDRSCVYGTPGYIPPEAWATNTWDAAGDIFSLGVVMLQMIINRTPSFSTPYHPVFVENCQDMAAATSIRNPPIYLMPHIFCHLKKIVTDMLDKKSNARPSARELLHDDWVAGLEFLENHRPKQVVTENLHRASGQRVLREDGVAGLRPTKNSIESAAVGFQGVAAYKNPTSLNESESDPDSIVQWGIQLSVGAVPLSLLALLLL